MSEGELYKRVDDFWDPKKNTYPVITPDAMKEVLDEARKEFPMSKELVQNLTGGPVVLGSFKDDPVETAKWFLKWFGEVKM